jgi:hypothetical protein
MNRNLAIVAAGAVIAAACCSPAPAADCEMAKVLFGKISLSIIVEKRYETALIRNASFDSKDQDFGAFRGELTVDRGGFSIRNNNQVVVGLISPALEVEGLDDSCDKNSKVFIKKVQQGVYVILNGGAPVGTITGRFPKNTFGVR